jgi:outer membrane lipoprotein-sorting protein
MRAVKEKRISGTVDFRGATTASSIADEPKVKIEIAEIDLNPQLDDGLFVFELPAGAQSIRMVPVEEIYEEEGATE